MARSRDEVVLRRGRRLVAVHAPGSLHFLGLRRVTDVLECQGWRTSYVCDDIAATFVVRLPLRSDDQT